MKARRVVAATNAEGKSFIQYDDVGPGYLDFGGGINNEIWVDDPTADAQLDPAQASKFNLTPPLNGSVCRIFTHMPPGESSGASSETIEQAASRFDIGDTQFEGEHGMHSTATLDYTIVLSGEIYMIVDEGEALLKAGDVCVQQATRHAFVNRGPEPCTIAVILISSPSHQ